MWTINTSGPRSSSRDRNDLISPPGKSYKNTSSSPLDRTVAETPSPGGNSMFSPESVHIKALDSPNKSPSKPFDEGSPDSKSVWGSDHNGRTIGITSRNKLDAGNKSSQYMRYANRISTDSGSRIAAPVPFLSTGSPPQSSFKEDSFSNTPEHYNSVALTNEIVRAQKLGERRAKVKPNSLFRSTEKKYGNKSSVKMNQILAREIAEAADEGAIEYERYHSNSAVSRATKSWEAQDAVETTEQEDNEPFDCGEDSVIGNLDTLVSISSMQYVEEAKKYLRDKVVDDKTKNYSVRQHRGSSALTPHQVLETMKILRDSDKPEMDARDEKKEGFSDEPNATLTVAAGDKDFDRSGGEHASDEEESLLDNKQGPSKTRTALLVCLLFLLVICGVVAGLFATGKFSPYSNWFNRPGVIVIDQGTSAPTSMEESNLFEGSKTVACENAVPLTEMDRAYYGSNWKAFWDPTIDTCGDQMSTGYAVWYSFTTNSSKLVEASTCNNADFDTQITIMTGSCSETSCVSFNDQGCGDQSLVTWYAEANTTYYIMVHGFREASGTFGLTLSNAVQHDQCDNAVILKEESVLAGTTAGASALVPPPQCDGVDLSEDGVWYEVAGVSGFYKAELLRGYTGFSGQVSVYRSVNGTAVGCSSLMCEKGSSSGSATWFAKATETYYVYVNGKDGSSGDFDLFLGQNEPSSCNFATQIDANSVGFLASTKGSNPQNVPSCGYTDYHTAPGKWFSVMGTGDALEATTCGAVSDLDTQISVFRKGCDALECIGGTGQDHPCSKDGSVIWSTEPGEIYNIYVSGRSSRVGDFVLNINDAPVANGSTCEGPLELELTSTSFQSNTTDSLAVTVDRCSGSDAVRGIWHRIIGTGATMTISVCNDETDFDARVSVFTGSCTGLSCIAYTESKCGVNDKITITTHVGEEYDVLVHGSDDSTIGNYLLTIEERETNDVCGMASTLDVSSSGRYFGSTLSAKDSLSTACVDEVLPESKALWYAFMGTGETVTLSTCSSLTDFNTDVRVFSGTCSESECVSDLDDSYKVTGCGQQSSVSFKSTRDELYYARIGGTSAADAGSFLLEVNPKSRFFGPA